MPSSANIFDNTEIAFKNKSDLELFKAQSLFTLMGNKFLVSFGGTFTNWAIKLKLPVTFAYKKTIYQQFCGGETLQESIKTINELQKSGITAMLNYGVEFKETEDDFDAALQKNIEALDFAGKNKNIKVLCVKPTGYGRLDLYEKIQSKQPLNVSEKKEFEKVLNRFHEICKCAVKNQVAVYIDAEESWIQDTLDDIVELMMKTYNKKSALVYNTFQLYRHDRLQFLISQHEKAKSGGYWLGAKIVRGAYMEKERERATELNYPSPIHKNKILVDKDFNDALTYCLKNLETIELCIASQSEESNILALELMNKLKISKNHKSVVFSQLYGMGDHISFNLAYLGYNVCKYLPFGPVQDVIPYLIRRAQENTSVSGQVGRELSLIRKEIKRRKSLK